MDFFTHGIPVWVILIYVVYMALVQALVRPDETSSKGYVFLYAFLHLLAINLKLAFDPKKQLPPSALETTVTPSLWRYPPPPKG